MTARGTSGHASRPLPDNSVVHLSAAIAKIGAFEAPPEPTAVTLRYFEGLAPIEDDETGKWMRAIDQPERLELAMNHLGDMNPAWGAMLHDTIVPTMLDAGVRVNVIPSEAHGNLNIRLMPGDSIHDIIAQLTKTVADPQISFDIAPDSGENAPASSLDSPLYKTIEKVAPQDFPGAIVVPELSTGATDSAQLRLHLGEFGQGGIREQEAVVLYPRQRFGGVHRRTRRASVGCGKLGPAVRNDQFIDGQHPGLAV